MRTREDPELGELRRLGPFEGCTPRELRRIAALGERWTMRAGQLLLMERYRGEQVHVVLEGTAAVSRRGRPVAVAGPGSVLGERGVLFGGDRNATVITQTTVRFLTFGREEFHRLMREHPRVAERIHELAAAHVPSATD